MSALQSTDSLVRAMQAEAELIERVIALELKLKSHVIERSWKGLEQTIRKIQPAAQKIAQIDEERERLFLELRFRVGAAEEAGIYQVIVLLPREEREELGAAFRRLKLTVLSLQGMTGGIDLFLSTVTETMQQILAQIYPYRKGKIYSRRGKAKPVEANPMLISRRL